MQVNISLLSPFLCFSNSSLYPYFFTCFDSTISSLIFITFTFTNLLLFLPLYILVLWMGLRRWRHQRSVTSITTSHSDIFTYNMVTLDIVGVLGSVFYCCANYTCSQRMMMVGYYFSSITYPAQTFFHCLTCVERYLAVVHPITYLGLKKAGGVKVRNISIGCAWMLSFGFLGLTALYLPNFPTNMFFVLFAFTVTIISYCSLSVLRVLIRLGLGKVGEGRERIDQSKMRAFHTIIAIIGTLMVRFLGLVVCIVMVESVAEIGRNGCIGLMSGCMVM